MASGAKSPFRKSAHNEQRWRECLARIRMRDAEALAQLYDETSGALYGLALRILNNSADAEEVVLDVYQHIWISARTFDESRGSVWSWLVVLTRSRALDRLRRTGARRRLELPADPGVDTMSPSPSPEKESIFCQERKVVFKALEVLTGAERTAINLAFFQGLTHSEIAEALGQPLGTIKTRIRSGMRKLRDVLGSFGES